MRHHRGAKDGDGDVEHLGIPDQLRARDEASGDGGHVGVNKPHLDGKAARDAEDEEDDQALDVAEAAMLQRQDHDDVERRQADAGDERQPEEKIERNGGAENFGQVAGGNRHLAQEPERDRRRSRVRVTTGLREIPSARDPESCRQRLQHDRHQVRQHDHAEQRVAEPGAASDVCRPVPGVHVADGHQVARPREREQLLPEARGDRDGNAAVHLGEAHRRALVAPANPAAGSGRSRRIGRSWEVHASNPCRLCHLHRKATLR